MFVPDQKYPSKATIPALLLIVPCRATSYKHVSVQNACGLLQQGADCLTLLYTPNNDAAIDAIVAAMCANNVPSLSQSKTLGFASIFEVST